MSFTSINWDAVDLGEDELDDAFHTEYFGPKRDAPDDLEDHHVDGNKTHRKDGHAVVLYDPRAHAHPQGEGKPQKVPYDHHHPDNKAERHAHKGDPNYERAREEFRNNPKNQEKVLRDSVKAKQAAFSEQHKPRQIDLPEAGIKGKVWVGTAANGELNGVGFLVCKNKNEVVDCGMWFDTEKSVNGMHWRRYKQYFEDYPSLPYHIHHQNNKKNKNNKNKKNNNNKQGTDVNEVKAELLDRLMGYPKQTGNDKGRNPGKSERASHWEHPKTPTGNNSFFHHGNTYSSTNYERVRYSCTCAEIITTYPLDSIEGHKARIIENPGYDAKHAANYFTSTLYLLGGRSYIIVRRTKKYNDNYAAGVRDPVWDTILQGLGTSSEDKESIVLCETTGALFCRITFERQLRPITVHAPYRGAKTDPSVVPKPRMRSETILTCHRLKGTNAYHPGAAHEPDRNHMDQ